MSTVESSEIAETPKHPGVVGIPPSTAPTLRRALRHAECAAQPIKAPHAELITRRRHAPASRTRNASPSRRLAAPLTFRHRAVGHVNRRSHLARSVAQLKTRASSVLRLAEEHANGSSRCRACARNRSHEPFARALDRLPEERLPLVAEDHEIVARDFGQLKRPRNRPHLRRADVQAPPRLPRIPRARAVLVLPASTRGSRIARTTFGCR